MPVSIYVVIYAECSRPLLTHHRCASPIQGGRHHTPPSQRGAMGIGQEGRGPHPVSMAPSLIREHLFHTRTLRVCGAVKPKGRSAPCHPDTDAQSAVCCIGSLSICDSIARTAACVFADGGRILRR